MENTFFIALFALVIAKTIWKVFLETSNLKSLSLNKNNDKNIAKLGEEQHQKMIVYSKTKTIFQIISIFYSSAILLLLLFTPLLGNIFNSIINVFGTSISGLALSFFAFTFIWSLFFLPFELYKIFVIEERFGFNNMNFKIFLSDKLKETCISLALTFVIIATLLYLNSIQPNFWWITASVAMLFFSLLLQIVFPKLILPLFYKFTPLEEGPLKKELLELAADTKFDAKEIMVIDGSKRSQHSNAFFTGIGKARMVVLFDTLIKQLDISELKAVVAHEIGHYKEGHIIKGILFSLLQIPLAFYIVHLLNQSPVLLQIFSLPNQLVSTLLILSLFSGLVTFWISPLRHLLSRKHEYEADHYAKKAIGSSLPLIEALRKLHKENLSNLYPSLYYRLFYYSHPTLEERKEALQKS